MASQTSIVAKQVRLMEYTGLSEPSKGNGRGGLVRQAWHYKSKLLLPSQTCSESMPGPACGYGRFGFYRSPCPTQEES